MGRTEERIVLAGDATRALTRAAGMIRRVEREGLGRNAGATRAAVTRYLELADGALSRIEELGGAVAGTKMERRYWDLRDRATLAGLRG